MNDSVDAKCKKKMNLNLKNNPNVQGNGLWILSCSICPLCCRPGIRDGLQHICE
eukprot:m.382340 g.382340  ORF g.382340 m.382340 type:complete len:54 (+) comp16718_c0_seq66:294-455(+)